MPGETVLYASSTVSIESCCAIKQLHMTTTSLALLIGKSNIGIGPSDPKVLSGLIAAVTGGTELSVGPALGGRHCSEAVYALLASTANSFDLRS